MGIRILKTAVAATLAIYLAQWLDLGSPLSAGLLAILGVDVTKKRSLRSATIRLLASLFGLFVGSILFYVCGFQIWVMALFVMSVYPILARLKLSDGIVTGTVVMIHLFAAQSIEAAMIWNEVKLLFVGLGTATIINLIYMPNPESRLQEARKRIDELFSDIFGEIAIHLREGDNHIWDGKELLAAGNAIKEGFALSVNSAENKLFYAEDDWRGYFDMRRQQLESIDRMLDLVSQVYRSLPHGEAAAQLFDQLKVDVKETFYTGNAEKELDKLERSFKSMELPRTREEFEMRSAILQLCLELKSYLVIAKTLKKRKENNENTL
ncbi:aromatic acid exporter family protein [Paenibacillus contaminans]|uniref:Aromatic acid exporter family protein n=1 Tax=Paenibacillus contaminans TaxID=450362 RepID=A0A329MHM1_9BACL|nr:aromatic acid exporter family protein [Paenibacillus contaminans]RAV18876.1 aromatic acid exporter family protein [Paenibacillus contaminans]